MITKDDCFYCHTEIVDGYPHGLDRVDNNVGYTPENVVTCCTLCNMMKHTDPVEAFLIACSNVATFMDPQLAEHFEYDPNYTASLKKGSFLNRTAAAFSSYKCSAKAREIPFEISRLTFLAIQKNPCTYCGNDMVKRGLDRIDSSKGYILGNVCACCTRCNYLKNDLDLELFQEHCTRIFFRSSSIRKQVKIEFLHLLV